MKEQVSEIRRERTGQLQELIRARRVTCVFQPIFAFREGAIVGFEALVRGPEGSLIETPEELFGAAADAGLALELNVLCLQEVLRAFARRRLDSSLFVNVSPQLILQRGFDRERAERFLAGLGVSPDRVVIELTENYPAVDFRLVHESLMLYRSMGFRVAIDDLGEGFASLRLWSELKPEFVKADKHFVTGLAADPVKAQFLRAIQHIAENSGSQVIAEGIEDAADFKMVRDLGVSCGQGWFIGRPSTDPSLELTEEARRAQQDTRLPVTPAPRLRAGSEPCAHDFVRAVDALTPLAPLSAALERFARTPALASIPIIGAAGIEGVVSRSCIDLVTAPGAADRSCIEYADRAPIRVEADLDLAALTAILVESDSRHLADGFVITSRGRYLGMGTAGDVMRALNTSRIMAARYTNPLTFLPGQVPINEHIERLLARKAPFSAWFVEIDQMRGLNDSGFGHGDGLIHDVARLLESVCEPGVDFAGHVSGTRFVVLTQSDDWAERAQRALDQFPALLATHVRPEVLERGYFSARSRDGRDNVRPLPKLVIGVLPVLPGVFESRHEVVAAAKHAAEMAAAQAANGLYIDQQHGNAYPQSLLFSTS